MWGRWRWKGVLRRGKGESLSWASAAFGGGTLLRAGAEAALPERTHLEAGPSWPAAEGLGVAALSVHLPGWGAAAPPSQSSPLGVTLISEAGRRAEGRGLARDPVILLTWLTAPAVDGLGEVEEYSQEASLPL